LKDYVVQSAHHLGLYGPDDLMTDYKRRDASGQHAALSLLRIKTQNLHDWGFRIFNFFVSGFISWFDFGIEIEKNEATNICDCQK